MNEWDRTVMSHKIIREDFSGKSTFTLRLLKLRDKKIVL